MIVFLILAIVMLALVSYFVLPELLRKEQGTHVERDMLNLDVLRDQLCELDADLRDGTIDAAGYRSARRELECRVAEEADPASLPTRAISPQHWPAFILALGVPIVAGSLYVFLGTPGALAPVQAATTRAQNSPPVTPEQIEGMVSRLAAKLKSNPDDADGWRMLARSYETMRRFEPAVDAYRHLLALTPDNPDVLADYAVTLAMSLDQSLSGEPEKLINRALEIDPKNIQALALSGSAAFERKEYADAIKPWKKILALVPADSDMARSIAANVAKAESLAGVSDGKKSVDGNG
jgi:cytochrome c-type biogenesis protein CcmH